MSSEDFKRRACTVIGALLAAMFLCFSIGCTSEREQRMKEYRKMHETLKSTPDQPPGKWERVNGE